MILGGRLLAINPAWTRRDRALLALAWLLAALDAIAFGRADPRGPAGALAYVVLGVWSGLARVPPAPPSIANSPYRIPTLPAQRPGPALAMRILLWPYVGLHLLVLALMALLCVVFWGDSSGAKGSWTRASSRYALGAISFRSTTSTPVVPLAVRTLPPSKATWPVFMP